MIFVITRVILEKVRNSWLVLWNIPLTCHIYLKGYYTYLKWVLPFHLFISSAWGQPWVWITLVMGAVFPSQPFWGLQPCPKLSGGTGHVPLKRTCCKSQTHSHTWGCVRALAGGEGTEQTQTHLPGYCCSVSPLWKSRSVTELCPLETGGRFTVKKTFLSI